MVGELAGEIEIQAGDAATAGALAQELGNEIRNADASAEVNLKKADPATQELGTILSILLGSASVIAVAKGIQAWLKGHQEATVIIRGAKGEIIADNLTPSSALEVIRTSLEKLR